MKRLGAFISSLCLGATLFAGAAAAQEGGLAFFAEPAPGSSVTNGYYVIDAEPGDSLTQALLLRNSSGKTLKLRIYPSDGTTSIYGGADYTGPDAEVSGVGSWIALLEDEVTLKPKESKTVTFRIRVPEDAPTGENLGGISIFPVTDEPKTEVQDAPADEATAQVVVEYRRVIAVQVNTPGKAEPQLLVSGVKPSARPDGAYLNMNIANEGTALTTGRGVIKIPGLDYEREFELDTFVPHSRIFYPVRFDDSIPEGEHEASIRIEYDDGDKVVEWSSTFAVGEELLEELIERGAPGAVAPTTRGNLVPYAAALAAAMFAFFVRRRMKRHAVVTAADGPTPLPVNIEPAAAPMHREPSPAGAVEPPPVTKEPATAPTTAAATKAAPVKPVAAATAPTPTTSPAKTNGSRSSSKTGAPKAVARRKKTVAPKTARAEAPKSGTASKKTGAKKTGAPKASTGGASKKAARTSAAKKAKTAPAAKSKSTKRTVAAAATSKRKTSAKRSTAASKTSTKSTSKRATVKKSAPKTSAKKKASTKSTSTRTTVRKSAAKASAKSTSTRTTVRKSAAKTSAKKTPAKTRRSAATKRSR